MSKCVYLASMGVKINHTIGVENQELFQNAYLMVMPVETCATTKDKIAKMYAFVHRNIMGYTKKLNKIESGCTFVI